MVHPCAASYVKQASARSLWTARRAEQAKTTKYKDLTESMHMDFVPLETLGAFGKQAQEVVRRIVSCADPLICCWTKRQVRIELTSAVSLPCRWATRWRSL